MIKLKLPSTQLSKKRKCNSKYLKNPKTDDFCENKENLRPMFVPPPVAQMVKGVRLCARNDRETELGTANPYELPERQRLFSTKTKPIKLKPEPFIMEEVRTICNLDPTFYESVEGRPLRQFVDVKRYMRDIRNITIIRTDAAFSKDRILAIEDKHRHEWHDYQQLMKFYELIKNNFVKFVEKSFTDAKAVQMKAEVVARKLAVMADNLEAASYKYVNLRNSLGNVAGNFDNLTLYARVLNGIAPPWWRQEYDHVNNLDKRTYIYVEQLSSEQRTDRPKKNTSDGYELTLVKYMGTPRLYMKTPAELIETFDSIATQCANYMKIDVATSTVRKTLKNTLRAMREHFECDISDIEDYVEGYEAGINFYAAREEACKNAFFRILMNEFQDLYASYENTKLFTCIQFVHSLVLDVPDDPNDSIVTLMTEIERLYFELSLDLEKLDHQSVKAATKMSFVKDIKEMNDANRAKRVLKEYNILLNSFYASFEPPRPRRRPLREKYIKPEKKQKRTIATTFNRTSNKNENDDIDEWL